MFSSATCWLTVCATWAGTGTSLADAAIQDAPGASRHAGPAFVGDLNAPNDAAPYTLAPIEARAGHVLNSALGRIETSGTIPSWAFVPLEPGATMPRDLQVAALVQPGWPHAQDLPVLTIYVRTPGSRDAQPPSLMTQAPFPTGAGMGLVGLALALGVTAVRRYRLGVV